MPIRSETSMAISFDLYDGILFLNNLFGANLLLHFIVSLRIYLYHYMVGFNTIVMTSLSIATE
jgi:hypothetical protein